jgi:hypothetical protein
MWVEALGQQAHNPGALLRGLHQHKAQAQHCSPAHVIADVADSKVQQALHGSVVGGAPAVTHDNTTAAAAAAERWLWHHKEKRAATVATQL